MTLIQIPYRCIIQTFLHILLFTTFSNAQFPSKQDSICSNTLYPTFCKSILANHQFHTNKTENLSRLFINQSLYMTNNFKFLVNRYLQSSNQYNVSQITKYALQDCEFLTNLNIDFLSVTSNLLKTDNVLNNIDINHVQTMLSATMTNLDSCYDGLKEVNYDKQTQVIHDLSPQISNVTMIYSLSLDFFTKGWVTKIKPNNNNNNNNNNSNNRRLFEIGEMRIVVNAMVVVNPNGSGNFTTINDAIASAPKDTKEISGYFGIYVIAGVYEEYVSIPTNKQYLFMLGDGIGQTIITGNRSVKGGSTTFRSATFGNYLFVFNFSPY